MTTTATEAHAPERLQFKTELKQLLDLIVHSLYTKKEIFLRELISNAADAIDKIRFAGLTHPDVLEGDANWKIKIIPDEKAGTLTVSDNGIGMNREQVVENLGTIARSGTRAFLEQLKSSDAQNRPELIGQFGVGFYSSFMVADRVTVVSRPAGTREGVRWESDGQGEFSIETVEKERRGTDVVLHLRDDAKEFLSPWRIREIVKRYSDYIDHPIVMDVEKERDGNKAVEEETLNSRQAIWLRPKHEIKPEEYNAFYKQISRDLDDPLKVIHVAAEGAMEFRALMFLPAHRPLDFLMGPEKKSGLDLYVRRVLIQHEAEELAPPYLRFVRGVVDSSDLPLNVSREILQVNPVLARIKSNIVNRILKTLEEMKGGEYEAYVKFYKEFGSHLKEGAATDFLNRDRLADLLLFESTKAKPGEYTTLEQYLQHMGGEQKEIYYLIGESRALLENSPYLEAFRSRGQEVLLLTEPIDEYFVQALGSYKDKPLKAIDRGDVPADPEAEAKLKEQAERFRPLLETLKKTLEADVKEVRLSARLKESAAVLVADEYGLSAHMERLLHRVGRGAEAPEVKRTLELNPDHPVAQGLLTRHAQDPADPLIEIGGRLLLDEAVVAEGSRVKDPAGFARRVNELLARQVAPATQVTAD
jgi:molecular chaperone HtpG